MQPTLPLTVLNISPEVKGLEPLKWLDELSGLADIPNVELTLVGGPDCTRKKVANAFRRRANVIIWTGHGVPGGLAVSQIGGGPDFVNVQFLTTHVKLAKPRLIVLATCNSMTRDDHLRSLAQEIAKSGVNVVGFHVAANDRAAVEFNVELVQALAIGATLSEAFDVAIEAIECDYPTTACGIFMLGGITNGLAGIWERLEAVETATRETRVDVQEIKATVNALTKDLSTMSRALNGLIDRPIRNTRS